MGPWRRGFLRTLFTSIDALRPVLFGICDTLIVQKCARMFFVFALFWRSRLCWFYVITFVDLFRVNIIISTVSGLYFILNILPFYPLSPNPGAHFYTLPECMSTNLINLTGFLYEKSICLGSKVSGSNGKFKTSVPRTVQLYSAKEV